MKKYIIIFLLLLSVNFIYSEQMVDFILAKIGREIILFSDLARHISQMRNAQMWDERMTELDILESLVENKLIVQKARELNVRIDERRINNMVDSQLNQIRSSFNSEEEFYRELRSAGLILSDLRQYYEDLLRDQFLRESLIQTEIRSKINLTDAELIAFYEEEKENFPTRDTSYELAMILRIPKPSEETDKESLEKIQSIQNLIIEGNDFDELARNYSNCPSGQFGGDLGFFTRGMMVAEFENAAFELDINEISDIVKTEFGYHLIKVTEKQRNEIKASHILIMIQESEDDIIREKLFLQNLIDRIDDGENFSDLASIYSDDQNSRENNGVIGILTREEFPRWFIHELSTLEKGFISEILEYQNTLYIFTINEVFEPRSFEFSEIKEQLRELLLSRRQFELYEHWMEDLKTEIFVYIFEDRLNETIIP